MSKTNCNIVKDLLPSYMENICSEESRQLIDTHFSECNQCKQLYLQLKKEGSFTEPYQTREFDYLKQVRNSIFRKNALINVIIALLFSLQFYCTFYHYCFTTSFASIVNSFLPLVIIVILFFTLPDYAEKEVPNKLKFTILGIEFTAMSYMTGLFLYLMQTLKADILPFGLEASKIGPFFATQVIILQFAFTITFYSTLYLSTKKKRICPALHFLPIGGFSLSNHYLILIHNLADTVSAQQILKPFLIITATVSILVGVYMVLNRKHL